MFNEKSHKFFLSLDDNNEDDVRNKKINRNIKM